MRTHLPESLKFEVIRRYRQGEPTKKLAKEYGVCFTTINLWDRTFKKIPTTKSILRKENTRLRAILKEIKKIVTTSI